MNACITPALVKMPSLGAMLHLLHTSEFIYGCLRTADDYSAHYAIKGLYSNNASQAVWIGAIGRLYNGLATVRTKAVFNDKGQLVFKAYASGRYVGRWNTATNNGSIIGWYGLLRGGV